MEQQFEFEVKPAPKTLSGWVRAAVEDAQRLSKTPGFRLNMGEWNYVRPGPQPVCQVCLGGAAMVGRGVTGPGVGPVGYVLNHAKEEVDISYILDCIRTGDVLGLELWGLPEGIVEDPGLIQLCSVINEEVEGGEHEHGIEGLANWGCYLAVAGRLEALGY